MVRKLTQEEFINKAINIHSNKYDYSLLKYINSKTKILVKCNTCNITIQQFPSAHLIYKECWNCHKLNLHNNFVNRSKEKHGNKFEYLTEYTGNNNNSKITFKCNICLVISTQFINNHLQGLGCKSCWLNDIRATQQEFINKAIKIHGDNFDYAQVEYINESTKIKIKCNTCLTIFEQTPGAHIHHRHKCKRCNINNQTKTLEEFIKHSKLVHGNKYDYSLTEYINAHTNVKIKCNKCKNVFNQTPRNHAVKGCPICNFSKGEEKCLEILQNSNFVKEIIPQFKFKDCKNKLPLPFDFKVILNNYTFFILEFDGKQHYEEVEFFSRNLDEQQRIDKIKHNYCENNDIKLLIIRYDEYNKIENIITLFILQMLNL